MKQGRNLFVAATAAEAQAMEEYRAAPWSLYHIEILSHHFCSVAPFPREDAPAYPGCLADLREAGLVDLDRKVTATGIRFIAALCSTPAPAEPANQPPHPDDLSVDRFAAAMKAKLARKRAEGRGGWSDRETCSNGALSQMLVEHIRKGDPVDVANFAMMIHQRGERIDGRALP
jgi:hypothetical protein